MTMIILAIDNSTPVCSIALARGPQVLVERSWSADSLRSQQMFPEILALLGEACVELEAVELFSVGLGPGSFSGIRAACAAMNGFALPGGRRVTGVSTAEVLAWPHLSDGSTPVAVVGDVRRGHLSLAVFESRDRLIQQAPVIELIQPATLFERLPRGCTLISADRARLTGILDDPAFQGVRPVCHAENPSAGALAAVTYFKQAAGTLPERPLPIYMHGAVATAPRFSPSAA